jgi:hypothetical protein
MFHGKTLDQIKTHFMLNFFPENRAVHEITWKNIMWPDRPQIVYNKAHALFMLDN